MRIEKHCDCGCIYLEAKCPNCNRQDQQHRIEELETKLVKLLEVGNVMAASIEGNYYIAGIATKWREAINIKGEQP